MNSDAVARLESLGRAVTQQMVAASMQLYAPLHSGVDSDITVRRDHRYGPHERHRLDLFIPRELTSAPRAVLLFVHGGGFVRGDKMTPGSPFYDNVGYWAA